MTITKLIALAAVAMLPAAAMAQDGEADFWLKAAPNNIQGCIAADPSFTRKHTFTLAERASRDQIGGRHQRQDEARAAGRL